MRVLILLLVASACIVQTRANILDKITGGGDENKQAKNQENEKSYRGGMLEQVEHAVVDAGVDRLSIEVQDKVNVPMADTVTKLVAKEAKKKIHEKINDQADKKKQSGEQQQQPAAAQPKEEKNGLAGLMDKVQKVVSRRKRSTPAAQNTPKESGMSKIFSKIRSFGQKKDTAPDATKSKDSAKSKVEAETKVKVDETEAEKSDVEIDEEETDGTSVKSKAVNRRKRSVAEGQDKPKEGGMSKILSKIKSFRRKKEAAATTTKLEGSTKPEVKSKAVSEAVETADDSENEDDEEVRSTKDNKVEHSRSKRASGEGTEPKELNPLKRFANKLQNLGSSSKKKVEPKGEQKPKQKQSLLRRAFGDIDGDDDKEDDAEDYVVL